MQRAISALRTPRPPSPHTPEPPDGREGGGEGWQSNLGIIGAREIEKPSGQPEFQFEAQKNQFARFPPPRNSFRFASKIDRKSLLSSIYSQRS